MNGTQWLTTCFAAGLLAWGLAGCEREATDVVPPVPPVRANGDAPVEVAPPQTSDSPNTASLTSPAAPTSLQSAPTEQSASGAADVRPHGSALDQRRRLPANAVADPGAKPVASRLPTRRSRPRTAGELADITFDDLKFDMEKGSAFLRSMLTRAIEQLAGTRVRIRGYMLPSFQQSGITQFVLVRDNMQCCFGPGAALYDCVVVDMLPGKTTDFSVRPVAVEGTFSINELKGADGAHLAIYHLVGERVTAP